MCSIKTDICCRNYFISNHWQWSIFLCLRCWLYSLNGWAGLTSYIFVNDHFWLVILINYYYYKTLNGIFICQSILFCFLEAISSYLEFNDNLSIMFSFSSVNIVISRFHGIRITIVLKSGCNLFASRNEFYHFKYRVYSVSHILNNIRECMCMQ